MKIIKRLAVAVLVVCSFMFVAPMITTTTQTGAYTVEAASKPKMKVKLKKAKQQGQYYIVEGKVYNKTNSKLDFARVDIKLYSKKNKKGYITRGYDSIMWMDKKGTWKFSGKIYVGNKKVKSYKASAEGTYYRKAGYTKLSSKVTSFKKKTSYGFDEVTVKGKIQNKTGKKLKSIFVTYAFYDKSGNILSTRFCGYYKGYKNKKKFTTKEQSHLMAPNLKVKKCKIVEVHGWT